jgi:hypothetical protein
MGGADALCVADRLFVEETRNAEIAYFREESVVKENVQGFEVAVDDVLKVEREHPAGDAEGNEEFVVDGKTRGVGVVAEGIKKRAARHKFCDDYVGRNSRKSKEREKIVIVAAGENEHFATEINQHLSLKTLDKETLYRHFSA